MDLEIIKLEIDKQIAKLNTILLNFNKAPKTIYTKQFLVKEKNTAKQIYNTANEQLVLQDGSFTFTELDFINKAIKKI